MTESPPAPVSKTKPSWLNPDGHVTYERLARLVLLAFILTFVASRVLVLLIMTHRIPDLYLHLGGTHIHHLNYGIFLLSGVGAYLIFSKPRGVAEEVAAIIYAIGLGLTFDEFGMWVHLGGPYWQRASFDAVVVIGALLVLLCVAPSLRQFTIWNWIATLVILAALVPFGWLLQDSLRSEEHRIGDKLKAVESESPP